MYSKDWYIALACALFVAGCQHAGLCAGVTCSDAACTTGVCNEQNGQCEDVPVANGTTCDFGGPPGVCNAGICEAVDLCAGIDCHDSNPCTTDSCDPVDGSCRNEAVDDGIACGPTGICQQGVCEDGAGNFCEDAATRCNDGNDCTDDSCDQATGNCSNTAVEGVALCNQGTGYCLLGSCIPF